MTVSMFFCSEVLIALAPESFYRNPLIHQASQVFMGPDVSSSNFTTHAGRMVVHLPPGVHSGADLQSLFNRLHLNPDILFVKADASRRILVSSIDALPCQKVLLVGDTHHMNKPISSMISYALSEPWDLISSEHDRHHLPLFAQAGLRQLTWLPCFTMNPYRLQPQPSLDERPVFVGSLSPHHQHRQRFLAQLQSLGNELHVTTAPQIQAAQLYNRHAISLNVSLNGDLNFRIMEVLAAGGCLLTDRLGPDSGLDILLTEGQHFLAYSTALEAAEQIRWLQAHPEQRLAIAQAGYSRFWSTFSPEQQCHALVAALNGQVIPELFRAPQ